MWLNVFIIGSRRNNIWKNSENEKFKRFHKPHKEENSNAEEASQGENIGAKKTLPELYDILSPQWGAIKANTVMT